MFKNRVIASFTTVLLSGPMSLSRPTIWDLKDVRDWIGNTHLILQLLPHSEDQPFQSTSYRNMIHDRSWGFMWTNSSGLKSSTVWSGTRYPQRISRCNRSFLFRMCHVYDVSLSYANKIMDAHHMCIVSLHKLSHPQVHSLRMWRQGEALQVKGHEPFPFLSWFLLPKPSFTSSVSLHPPLSPSFSPNNNWVG